MIMSSRWGTGRHVSGGMFHSGQWFNASVDVRSIAFPAVYKDSTMCHVRLRAVCIDDDDEKSTGVES